MSKEKIYRAMSCLDSSKTLEYLSYLCERHLGVRYTFSASDLVRYSGTEEHMTLKNPDESPPLMNVYVYIDNFDGTAAVYDGLGIIQPVGLQQVVSGHHLMTFENDDNIYQVLNGMTVLKGKQITGETVEWRIDKLPTKEFAVAYFLAEDVEKIAERIVGQEEYEFGAAIEPEGASPNKETGGGSVVFHYSTPELEAMLYASELCWRDLSPNQKVPTQNEIAIEITEELGEPLAQDGPNRKARILAAAIRPVEYRDK